MFNSGYKKEALAECSQAGEQYKETYNRTINNATKLHGYKLKAVSILTDFENYVNSMRNAPYELTKIASQVAVRRQAFEREIHHLELESRNADKVSGSVAGAGVLAGAGVAAFGPAAAMGVATTFGTASTGVAISTLAGVAKTSAALAWLGGGAMAAGGGGMVAGQALLAMAGPVGWAIGGTALLGGGLLASSKNKKIAEKAERQTREIKEETSKVKKINEKVVREIRAVSSLNDGTSTTLSQLLSVSHRDYRRLTAAQKENLMQLMNSCEALSKKIGEKIA